jgi:hypothetical protein
MTHSSEDEEEETAAEEPEKEKKKRKLVYKEPNKNKLTGLKSKIKKKKEIDPNTNLNKNTNRKSVRQSTIDKRYDPNEEKMEIKKRKQQKRVRQFTQEQLLQEAMKTESINLSQLVIYQQEEQQRKSKFKRKKQKRIIGASIKTVSRLRPIECSEIDSTGNKLGPPLIEEISNLIPDYNKKVNVKLQHYVTFSDQQTFNDSFPKQKPKEKIPQLCRITGKPARFITRDGIPYYDAYAFKVIKENGIKNK